MIANVVIKSATKKLSYERAIYNLLDFLGDIGGLNDALGFVGRQIVGFLTYGSLTYRMINILGFS